MLDKSVVVLEAVLAGAGTLTELTERSGLARATAYRLAVALEVHRLLDRDREGRWRPGPRLAELAAAASAADPLVLRAGPVLTQLRDQTGESAQLYRRRGDLRICIASAERHSGLRDTVPVGAVLPLTAGSAAQILLAATPDDPLLAGAAFSARTLSQVRRRGWAHSSAEREPGVASVSAPVHAKNGAVVAAISVSGPLERLTRAAARLHAKAVIAAAGQLTLP